MKKSIFAIAAVALMGIHTIASAETVRVATEPGFAPFEFVDTKTGKITGYDIDLVKALCKQAGLDCEIVSMGFDAIIPALISHTVDMAASGITITKERQKKVFFTDPVYTSGTTMLVRKTDGNKYKVFGDLKNKVICAQIGTTGQFVAEKVEGSTVRKFNTMSEAFMELKNMGCEAAISDRPVIGYFMAQKAANEKLFAHQLGSMQGDESLGFAIAKNNKSLQKKITKAFSELKANGEFKRISEKWFGK